MARMLPLGEHPPSSRDRSGVGHYGDAQTLRSVASSAVHVHFKVRVPGEPGVVDECTLQLYFADELTNRVQALEPYNGHKGQRLLDSRDMIFREGGTQLLLPVIEADGGYTTTYRMALRPGVRRRQGPRASVLSSPHQT